MWERKAMNQIYERYELLCDRREELKDMIAALRKIVALGIVIADDAMREDYEARLEAAQLDLKETALEMDELGAHMRAVEEAQENA
jgi:hypothetical protein